MWPCPDSNFINASHLIVNVSVPLHCEAAETMNYLPTSIPRRHTGASKNASAHSFLENVLLTSLENPILKNKTTISSH